MDGLYRMSGTSGPVLTTAASKQDRQETYLRDISTNMDLNSSAIHVDLPAKDDAERDVDALLASLGLQLIRRYMDQLHWKDESRLARAADQVEPGLKLENVAAHSWHVADATLLLASNFPEIDTAHALELAVVHDKLELFTGDLDPVGPDGQGTKSHAFNSAAQAAKQALELKALEQYVAQLRVSAQDRQRALILESIKGESAEARLVKAVDKLQALAFVLAKKSGSMTDDHLAFSLRYSAKAVEFFPKIVVHYSVLVRRLVTLIAEYRRTSFEEVVLLVPEPLRTCVERLAA